MDSNGIGRKQKNKNKSEKKNKNKKQIKNMACQWRSQNAEKVTHITDRLLYQAMILFNYVPFQNGTSLKKEFERILSFKVWKITFTTLGQLPWV